jgi:hypothetical protein
MDGRGSVVPEGRRSLFPIHPEGFSLSRPIIVPSPAPTKLPPEGISRFDLMLEAFGKRLVGRWVREL